MNKLKKQTNTWPSEYFENPRNKINTHSLHTHDGLLSWLDIGTSQ
jgi:hypothetical protein